MKLEIITGSRAEYGILRNLIKKLIACEELDVRVTVTGMHLEEKYGLTYKEIEKDGIEIYKLVDSDMKNTSDSGIIDSFTLTMQGYKDHFVQDRPDMILILGDRFEIYSVAITASLLRIPIIHLHGGEKTEGNYDEFIRHSISKMSTFHFAASDEFANRIIQLGEQPERVKNVGALGVENVKNEPKLSIEQISEFTGLDLEENKYFVIAFHPETLVNDENQNSILLDVLASFVEDYKFVFIGSNADTAADSIMGLTRKFVENHSDRAVLITSAPSNMYYSMIYRAVGFVGNSSSGLIEVPSLGKATVNIGDRQKGRLRGNSVIDVQNTREDIELGINKLLSFNTDNIINPYEQDGTSEKIINEILNNLDVIQNIKKEFNDK